jgi:hypothetical protein
VRTHRTVARALSPLGIVATLVMVGAWQAPPEKFVPDPVQPSDLTVRLDLVGTMSPHQNPTSPTLAGSTLLLIDQAVGLYRWSGSVAEPLLLVSRPPAGVKPFGAEGILNVAATRSGTTVYVMFVSSSAPKGVPRRMSPRPQSEAWYVLFAFDFDGAALSQPRPIVALQARDDGHTGGGLLVLDDGSVLFAAGDNGDSYEDGGTDSQNPANHLAKIVRIDPATGATIVVAVGVRNCQRLTLHTFDDGPRVSFVEPGGWVSEEIDSIRLADLIDPTSSHPAVNFGWGRSAADGRSREGTLFIDHLGNSVGRVSAGEPGFIAPVAEFGRETAKVFAVTGPVSSRASFTRITFLVADLVGGLVYAIASPPSVLSQPVYHVALVDSNGQSVTLKELSRSDRADSRFFEFPDGAAGVLLEHTGAFYRLTEVK